MRHLKQWLTVAISLLCLASFGQKQQKRMKIGDTIPNLKLKNVINHSSTKAELNEFKGKAIILDFWNKNCGSCINAMPKMQQLQEQFKDDLVILLVNSQPADTGVKIDYLFKKSPIIKGITLPMVLGDSSFSSKGKLFPHVGDPFHVWIDKNGVVRALTDGEQATSKNIEKLIAGKTLSLPLRNDIAEAEIDPLKSLLEAHNGALRNYLLYYRELPQASSRSKSDTSNRSRNIGYIYHTALFKDTRELGNYANYVDQWISDKNGITVGRRKTLNVIGLYQLAYAQFELPKVVIEKRDVDSLDCDWAKTTYFVYESFLPNDGNNASNEYTSVLRKDLENYFGMKGTIELRPTECLIFYRTDRALTLPKTRVRLEEDVKSNRGYVFRNGPAIYHIINRVKKLASAIVLDETGVSLNTKTDLILRSKLTDIQALNEELKQYGIGIKKETRSLPTLILRNVNQGT